MKYVLRTIFVSVLMLTATAATAQFMVAPTGIFERGFGLIPQVYSIADLRKIPRFEGKAVNLTDELRAAVYVWDGSVTPEQYALDPAEINMIALQPGQPGAWVNPMADNRRGVWTNSVVPGRKLRVNSGIFVGRSAISYLGATQGNNGATEFWAHDISTGRGPNDWDYSVNALNILERDNGGVNTAIVSRSTRDTGGGTIGLLASAVARSWVPSHGTWAIYSDAVAAPGSAGGVRNGEFNIINQAGNISDTDAEKPYLGGRNDRKYIFGLAAGGDATVFGRTFNVDEAIRISDNGAKFWSGIVYRAGGLATDANGEGRAIAMARGHAFVWFAPDNSESARIVSTGGIDGAQWRLDFANAAFRLSADGALALEALPVSNAVNHVQVQNAAAGQAPTVQVVGSDPDIDLKLAPAGSGSVIVGGATGVATDPSAFVATGWLAIKDATGAVRYIPTSDQPW